jgi:hypothetical protein
MKTIMKATAGALLAGGIALGAVTPADAAVHVGIGLPAPVVYPAPYTRRRPAMPMGLMHAPGRFTMLPDIGHPAGMAGTRCATSIAGSERRAGVRACPLRRPVNRRRRGKAASRPAASGLSTGCRAHRMSPDLRTRLNRPGSKVFCGRREGDECSRNTGRHTRPAPK